MINLKELSQELCVILNRKHGISLHAYQTEDMVSEVFNLIGEKLVEGEDVSITKFGKFGTHWIKAQTRTAPNATEAVFVPASRVLHFSGFTTLKKQIRDNSSNWEESD